MSVSNTPMVPWPQEHFSLNPHQEIQHVFVGTILRCSLSMFSIQISLNLKVFYMWSRTFDEHLQVIPCVVHQAKFKHGSFNRGCKSMHHKRDMKYLIFLILLTIISPIVFKLSLLNKRNKCVSFRKSRWLEQFNLLVFYFVVHCICW